MAEIITPPPDEEWTLTARWIFPVDQAPLENGAITTRGQRIVAVGGRRRADLDLGNVAILPGLVNAHTHLDLTGLRGKTPPRADFTDWLRAVIGQRRSRTPQQVEADIQEGVAECLRCGTTLVGDIAAAGQSWRVLSSSPLPAVVFHELLGLPEERAEQALAAATAWLNAHPDTPTCRRGLSPHAPYSVRASLFGQAALLARNFACPRAVHLAESTAELELLHEHRGPFVSFLKELGVWDSEGLAHDLEEVIKLCDRHVPKMLSTPKLFVHCNYLATAAALPGNSSIVLCPRTHAAFGHPPHPFREFLARGVRVALGTDSLASNPDLDVLAEGRFLRRQYPAIPGSVLVRMATLSGAEALGWHKETGSLSPGKFADLVSVSLPAALQPDPHDLLLDSDLPVNRVMIRGQWR